MDGGRREMKWRTAAEDVVGRQAKKKLLNKKYMIPKELERCHQLRERAVDAKKKQQPPNREDEGQREQEGIKCLRVMYEKSGEEEIY